jgi:hypothetical protein
MTTYRVTWTIDLDAERPEDAAACAQAIQRDRESISTVFEVRELNGCTVGDVVQVDLCQHPECRRDLHGVKTSCRFSKVSSQPKGTTR